LILGETGSGKELVARAIHQLSPRRDHLLVTVNCAALAPGVITSELFGHEQGAFTGATRRRPGRFELAHQGTIFLDEVGELPAETQVMLLRVLQERVIERVGGNEPIPVDSRVIAATHQDLTAAMECGRLRADLFFRLNVFPIHVPPLRERREDIPDLAKHFLHHFARRMNKPVAHVSPSTLKLLVDYPWPGNVRELENIVERAMIVTTGESLQVDPLWLKSVREHFVASESRPTLAELERRAIMDALAVCNGKIYGPMGAAAALGLKPTTLYGKMRKHQIPKHPLRK
jgi:formate hydrogenlyase transcriptional activator